MIFGLGWILIAVIIGIVLGKGREITIEEIEQLASQNNLVELYKKDWEYRWSKTCHAHAALFSILCIVVGLVLNNISVENVHLITVTTVLMICAVILWTLSAFRHVMALMGIADIMLTAGILLSGWLVVCDFLNS